MHILLIFQTYFFSIADTRGKIRGLSYEISLLISQGDSTHIIWLKSNAVGNFSPVPHSIIVHLCSSQSFLGFIQSFSNWLCPKVFEILHQSLGGCQVSSYFPIFTYTAAFPPKYKFPYPALEGFSFSFS